MTEPDPTPKRTGVMEWRCPRCADPPWWIAVSTDEDRRAHAEDWLSRRRANHEATHDRDEES